MFTIKKLYLRTWCKKNSVCVKAANRNSKSAIRSLKKMARNPEKCRFVHEIFIDRNGLNRTKISAVGGEVVYDGGRTNNTLEKLLEKNGYHKIGDNRYLL